MTLHVDNVKVHIVIPKDFLKEVDQQAAACYMSRSDFIRLALMEKLGRNQLIEQKADGFLASLDKYDRRDQA